MTEDTLRHVAEMKGYRIQKKGPRPVRSSGNRTSRRPDKSTCGRPSARHRPTALVAIVKGSILPTNFRGQNGRCSRPMSQPIPTPIATAV